MWKKGTSLEEEVSRDDFDAYVFIDRVFTRTSGEIQNGELDIEKLKHNFELIISNLQTLRSQVNNKAALLQQKCISSEKVFKSEIRSIIIHIEKIDRQFSDLDRRIRQVSEKVYIGDQLERKSVPRNQLQEAKDIICEFYKYISGEVKHKYAIETEEEEQLLYAADTIQKLSTLCLELPDDESFIKAKSRVTMAQEEIDQHLTNRFKIEMARNNIDSMRRIVNSLSFSKKFSNFINTFVDQIVNKINIHQDLTNTLVANCSEFQKLIESVFPNHNAVMLQLIQAIFTDPLKKNLEMRITNPATDLEQYLITVYSHFIRLETVIKQLSSESIVQDNAALNKLFKELFRPYLVNYIQFEINWLESRLKTHLDRFYTAVGHQKRVINEGGLSELYRDLQARFIHSTASSNATNIEKETGSNKLLLSQEVAVNILEDVKISLKRCKTLSGPTELSEDIMKINDILVNNLVNDYLNYGIYRGYQGVLSVDTKKEPNLLFFEVVHEANNIFQFFDKVLSDTVIPLITNPDTHSGCMLKRQQIMKDLETKINQGLEKLLANSIAYMHNILNADQKKTDFRPENNTGTFTTSPAAEKVVQFAKKLPPQIELYLDGQNKEVFATSLGLQFHRTLLDHLYSFSYSCEGGYTAMQDVNLYDEVLVRKLHCPILEQLFNCLLTLVNVVAMKPENLRSILKNHLENGLPKELLFNFVALRSDYRSIKHLLGDLK